MGWSECGGVHAPAKAVGLPADDGVEESASGVGQHPLELGALLGRASPLVGPVGVGKRFIAQALGYAAVRAGHTIRFAYADDFFRAMAQARVDHSTDKPSAPSSPPTCSSSTTSVSTG